MTSINRTIRNLLFFCLAFATAMSVDARELVFIGTATDMESGALAYTEEHRVQLDTEGQYQKSVVRYVGADGTLFAEKTLDFAAYLTSPTLYFEDPRLKQIYQAQAFDDAVVLTSSNDRTTDTNKLPLDEGAIVVDAGFDRMLLEQWDSLVSGEEKSFQFLALTRGSSIEFTLSLVSLDTHFARFRIEPSSWLVNLLVDPILLDYDVASKRLRRYEGITNIAKEGTDKNYSAIIEYRYLDEPTPVADTGAKHPQSS